MTSTLPETTYIYALVDPRDGRVRYVGKSRDPEQRIRHHTKPSSQHHLPVSRWIRKLKNAALWPSLLILDCIPANLNWQEYERSWIASLGGPKGPLLLNIAEGGEGGGITRGIKLTPEHRMKIAKALTGQSKSSEARARMSVAQQRRWATMRPFADGLRMPLEQRQSMSANHPWKGKKRPDQSLAMRRLYENDPSARQKTGEAAKRVWQRPGLREAARERRLGWKHSQLTKERIRIGHVIHNMRRELYGDSIQ